MENISKGNKEGSNKNYLKTFLDSLIVIPGAFIVVLLSFFLPRLGNNHAPNVQLYLKKSTISTSDSVFLNASSSLDPDGDSLIFIWTKGEDTIGIESTTYFKSSLPGVFKINLMVTDGKNKISQTKEIIVLQKELKPNIDNSKATDIVGAFKMEGRIIHSNKPVSDVFINVLNQSTLTNKDGYFSFKFDKKRDGQIQSFSFSKAGYEHRRIDFELSEDIRIELQLFKK